METAQQGFIGHVIAVIGRISGYMTEWSQPGGRVGGRKETAMSKPTCTRANIESRNLAGIHT